jgi:hypothetical protein
MALEKLYLESVFFFQNLGDKVVKLAVSVMSRIAPLVFTWLTEGDKAVITFWVLAPLASV